MRELWWHHPCWLGLSVSGTYFSVSGGSSMGSEIVMPTTIKFQIMPFSNSALWTLQSQQNQIKEKSIQVNPCGRARSPICAISTGICLMHQNLLEKFAFLHTRAVTLDHISCDSLKLSGQIMQMCQVGPGIGWETCASKVWYWTDNCTNAAQDTRDITPWKRSQIGWQSPPAEITWREMLQ